MIRAGSQGAMLCRFAAADFVQAGMLVVSMQATLSRPDISIRRRMNRLLNQVPTLLDAYVKLGLKLGPFQIFAV